MFHEARRITKDENCKNLLYEAKKGSNDINVEETWYKTCFLEE